MCINSKPRDEKENEKRKMISGGIGVLITLQLPGRYAEAMNPFLLCVQFHLNFFAHIKNGTISARAQDLFME